MNIELHKELARKFLIEAYQEGNLDVLDEILHTEYSPHESIGFVEVFDKMDLGSGIEKVKERMLQIRNGVTDLKFDIIELIAEKDIVMAFYNLKAKHIGPYLGIPATGKFFSSMGFHLFKFKDEKIHRVALLQDQFSLLRDIGRTIFDTQEEEQIQMYLDALKRQKITR